MRVAVIGAGAAATGVLRGLSEWGPNNLETWLFDVGDRLAHPPEGMVQKGFDASTFKSIYAKLRVDKRFAFPPPKSHFGATLPKHQVGGKRSLWRSSNYGGLTTIWGGGMFPFTDHELENWPIDAADLDPYYARIAERVGVCGQSDALNSYFTRDYINRPPLRTSPVIHTLIDTINSTQSAGSDYDFLAGSSRLALETRPGLDNSCDYLGECMLGCLKQAIWSADRELDQYRRQGLISEYIRGRVRRFVTKQAGAFVEVAHGDGLTSEGPFDRIFIAAGCIGSTEIVMRSLDIDDGPEMLDNAVMSFPVFYTGHVPTPVTEANGLQGNGYFSLCNASIGAIPLDRSEPLAQVSLYPAFDHLWRYYTPSTFWSALSPLWKFSRWRLLLARVFFAGKSNRTYSFRLVNNELNIEPKKTPGIGQVWDSFLADFRRVGNHAGFYIPPIPPSGQATSSHYASTFPYGSDVVPSRSGKIAPNVFLSDASNWPSAPSISPTFTIMANACRTVHEALASY